MSSSSCESISKRQERARRQMQEDLERQKEIQKGIKPDRYKSEEEKVTRELLEETFNWGSKHETEMQRNVKENIAHTLISNPRIQEKKTPEERKSEAEYKRLAKRIFVKNWPKKVTNSEIRSIPPMFSDFKKFDSWSIAMLKWESGLPPKKKTTAYLGN